jgi:hypothetical protein
MGCATAVGAVVYVDADASGGGDGVSWGTAYKYLQDGLAGASSGDKIWVAEGTYTPDQGGGKTPSDRTATFQLITDVAIYGGFAGTESSLDERDWQTNETILSGDINTPDVNTDNSYHVVTGGGAGPSAILDGLTITAGNADGGSANDNGGGMYNSYGNPTVTNCTFSVNRAYRGTMYNNYSNPTMTNCMFSGNSIVWHGGGICSFYSNPKLTNCTFSGNTGMFGGGMYNFSTIPTVINCTFSGNSADFGGGMYNSVSSNSTLMNCIFWGNMAPDGAQIYNDGTSSPTVSYCDIQDGGGGTNISSDPLFVDANGPDNISGTEDDNLRLLSDSPCIDAGDNNSVPLGVTSDPDGNPRFFDDPVTSDTGNGAPPIVDIGAYEYYREPVRIYVDADASGANDGTSWVNAYNYPQDALAVALRDDEIWMAEGTYKPDEGGGKTPGDRTATFQLIKGVDIYGGFAGTETRLEERNWETNETILSGDLDGNDVQVDPCDFPDEPTRGENSYHVVNSGWTGPNTILDGFTITAGNANGGGIDHYGGGILNDNNSPALSNCTIRGNYAYLDGGGIFNILSNSTLSNCMFIGNFSGDNKVNGHGGGIGNFYCDQTLTNCTFSENAARWGSGVYSTGGDTFAANCTFINNSASALGAGILNSYGGLMVTNCMFNNNSALSGGGISELTNSNTTATNCTFSDNTAIELGGGMQSVKSNSTCTNCIFSGNSAGTGGGTYNYDSTPTMTNCTFVGNSASNGEAIACDSQAQMYPSTVELTNCILWDSGSEIWNNDGSTITINYSDVHGGWVGPGGNNIDEDPLFIGPNGLDGIADTADDEVDSVHLKGYSPCINAGDPSGNYTGQIDIDRQPRIAYGRVDMGVDEVFPVAGDFEPDGDVDFGDFAIYCNNWLLGVE